MPLLRGTSGIDIYCRAAAGAALWLQAGRGSAQQPLDGLDGNRQHERPTVATRARPVNAHPISQGGGRPMTAQPDRELATLGGGCFWCLEAVFKDLRGVESVVSGYAGGEMANPTYEQVCGGRTGHAEVVQITFDPTVVSYRDLLSVFFVIHDPTTLNRQGADVGTQYRSAIFYHSDEQKRVAEEVIAEIASSGIWKNPIVTEVTPVPEFYSAEDYHQEYFARNPNQGYCQVVVAPKVAKFRSKFLAKLRG
jgi:peptide-methionine (S)-S-oxide reductase